MREYNFSLFTKCGNNILNPDNWVNKSYKTKLGRAPSLNDFDAHNVRQHEQFLRNEEFMAIVRDPSRTLYVKFVNGARKGSIAKIIEMPVIVSSAFGGYKAAHDSDMKVQWDCGKEWSFKLQRNVEATEFKDQHLLLVDYEGPTEYVFEKKPRPKLEAPVLYDNYGKVIEVGDWVMDSSFKIGKVSRISSAGTLWIDMLSMKSGKYANEVTTQQFGRNTSELLKMELPEGFEMTAVLMDKDVNCLDIVPTFTYQARHD